jgi:predicted alpha-1,2-mannosidase
VYTFHVQHDVAGLIKLFGSNEAFVSKLDSLFGTQYPGYKFDFQKQFPDMTGLTGMHSQGNEPAFHIPYLYCYAGQPWKTQKIIRQIMDAWYFNHPMGLCGDDDDGSLSAWYVFSALGFYPVCPGMPYYVIGSPLFEKSTIHLANDKSFTIIANNVSRQNKYIQSAKLNGKILNKPWFVHDDMINGGSLILEMGPKPNKSWGNDASAVPPSMTNR